MPSLSTMALGALLVGSCLVGTAAFGQIARPNPNDVYAINAGGVAINGWSADTDYDLGVPFLNNSQPVSLADVPHSDAPPAVYQDAREGFTFSYIFTGLKPNTSYETTLHFAELFFTSPRQRLFDIAINGIQVETDFDIVAISGGPFKAITTKYFVESDANGDLRIDFTKGSLDQPTVNALEISPISPVNIK